LTDRPADDILAGLARAWPELPLVGARLTGGGQNHAVVDTGELIVRVVRYPTPANLARLAREAALLQTLANRLPAPVPVPVRLALDAHAGEPAYIAYRRLPGVPLSRQTYAMASAPVRDVAARDLGRFLRALHASAPRVAGLDLPRPSPVDTWGSLSDKVRRLVAPQLPTAVATAVAQHFDDFLASAADLPPDDALVHGDFGTSNLLWHPETGRITAVLDFSEAHVGDRAVDLAALEASFGGDVLARAGYALDPGARHRVAFYQGTFALQDAVFGLETGDEAAASAGLRGTLLRFGRTDA